MHLLSKSHLIIGNGSIRGILTPTVKILFVLFLGYAAEISDTWDHSYKDFTA